MERDYKGKDEYGVWHYGWYWKHGDNHYIKVLHSYFGYTDFEVIPESVGQYTGLRDKNGKEIYGGDILKLDGGGKPCLGSVGFERGCFVFNADWLNKEKEYMPELYRYTFFAELKKGKAFKDCIVVEVIGNLTDNPNLLEGK